MPLLLCEAQDFNNTVSLEGITTTANMKRGSHIYGDVTYANSVLNVPVPADKHTALSVANNLQIKAYLSAIPASNRPQQSSSGYTRAIWVKFKVKSIGEGGYKCVEYEITSIKWASKQSLKYGVVRYNIGNDFMYPVFCNNRHRRQVDLLHLVLLRIL